MGAEDLAATEIPSPDCLARSVSLYQQNVGYARFRKCVVPKYGGSLDAADAPGRRTFSSGLISTFILVISQICGGCGGMLRCTPLPTGLVDTNTDR